MTQPGMGDRRPFNLNDRIMFFATPTGEERLRQHHESVRAALPDFIPQWTGLRRNSLGFSSMQAWEFSHRLGAAIIDAEADTQPVLPILFRAPEDPFHIDDLVAVRLNDRGVELVLEDVIANGVPEHLEVSPAGDTVESIMPFSTMVRAYAGEMYNGNPHLPLRSMNIDFLRDGSHPVVGI